MRFHSLASGSIFFAVVLLTVPLCMPVCASWVTDSAPGSYQADLAPSGMSETMGGSVFGGGGVSIDGGGGGDWSSPAVSVGASPATSGTGMWSYGGPNHNIWAQWGTTSATVTNPLTSSAFGTNSIALASSNSVSSFFNNPTFSVATSNPSVFSNGNGLALNTQTGILGASGVWSGSNQVTFDFNNQSATFNLNGSLPVNVPAGTPVIVNMSAAADATVGGNNFVDITFGTMGVVGRDESGSVVSTWKGEATEAGRMSMNGNEYMIPSGIGQSLYNREDAVSAMGIKTGSDITMNYKDGQLVQMSVDGKAYDSTSVQVQAATPIAGSLAATGVDPLASAATPVQAQVQGSTQSQPVQPGTQPTAAAAQDALGARQGVTPLTVIDNQGTIYLSGASKILSFHDENGQQIFGVKDPMWFAAQDGVVISSMPGIWKDQANNQGTTMHYGNNVWAVVEDLAGDQRVVALRSVDDPNTAQQFVNNLTTADGKTYDIKGVSPSESTLDTYGSGQVTQEIVTNLSGSAQEHLNSLLHGPVSLNNWSEVTGVGSLFVTKNGTMTYVDNRWDEVFCGYVSTEALKGFGMNMDYKLSKAASEGALPGTLLATANLQDHIELDPFFAERGKACGGLGIGDGSSVLIDRVKDHNDIIDAGYYGGQYSTIGISPLN